MTKEFTFKIDWLVCFIILLPTFYIYGMDIRFTQMAFFQVLAMVLLGFLHINKWLGGLLIWTLVQGFLIKDTNLHINHAQNLFYGLFIYQFVSLLAKKDDYKKYYWAFAFVMILNIFWCLRQMYNVDPIFIMADFDKQQIITEPSGFFGLPAFLGNYIGAVLPICMSLTWALVPFVLVGLFFSKSSFSIVAALVGFMFLMFFKGRKWFIASLVISSLLCGVYIVKYDMPSGQFERRIKAWGQIENKAWDKQFFGHGLGSLKDNLLIEIKPTDNFFFGNDMDVLKKTLVVETYKNDKIDLSRYINNEFEKHSITQIDHEMERHGMGLEIWSEAHNEYLQLFFELGLIGLFLILGFIYDLLRRAFKYGSKDTAPLVASFLAILVISFGHFPFHLARTAGPLIVLIALLEGSVLSRKKSLDNQF